MTNEQEQVVEPTFRTKRMRVWETRVAASAKSMAGDLRIYCAMADNEWQPFPVAVVTCTMYDDPDDGWSVVWIEVPAPSRRQGFAAELLRTLRGRLGDIDFFGVSPEGMEMQRSWEAWQDAVKAKEQRKAANRATTPSTP